MKKQYLEAGRIVNTHGVRGQIKIQPWCDSPDFLCSFDTIYIDSSPIRVLSSFVHKDTVIASLEGVNDIDSAVRLKNKVIFIDRSDASMPEGFSFVQDVIGAEARDADTDELLGTVEDVLDLPSGNIYVIKGEREILVPAVDEFIIEKDIDAGIIRLRLIEGM